jgi:hypothetical protein
MPNEVLYARSSLDAKISGVEVFNMWMRKALASIKGLEWA